MRRLPRCAVGVILLLATACATGATTQDRTLSAAGAAGPEDAPSVTTTAVVAPPPATPAPTVSSSTTARPPTTTSRGGTEAAPRTPPPPPPPTAPAVAVAAVSPATLEAVTTTVTEGPTTVNLKAVREQYLGERVYIEVTATSSELIISITIDYGDGHVVTVPQTQAITTPEHGFAQRSYVYPSAGRYRITATLTVVPGAAVPPLVGDPAALTWLAGGPPHTVTVATGFLQRPDSAPPTFPRLPPLVSE